MPSPFSTIEEFNGAVDGPTGGAIYTFAHTPAINAIALLVSVGLFFWFLFATYSKHHELPTVDKSLNRLSSFIVIGLLSWVAADQLQHTNQSRQSAEETPKTRLAESSRQALPLALLGMTGIGLPNLRRGKSQRRKRSYRNFGPHQR
ncbi:hypothetical protein [Leptothoe sp. PORK10 BA2]|uniref:hypothetical protein n=1 Tax=Leptothoe sp. PORK10 BA2 TaxID=3110254 RepID=UPI002B2050B6|nr:hypothetical protein [Leptothoe sp. PORK10 BA2]MEA5465842.1 hypothetical protein [Leptothoe sp. PORK10 BA2]